MIDGIFQCCYTNGSLNNNGIVSHGWTNVAVSENIPPEIFNECSRIQAVNVTSDINQRDEKGEILNLFKLVGKEKYLYVSRIQYGLSDARGRGNNSFEHTFIIPWENALENPNKFLTISNVNFKSSEEDAKMHYDEFECTEPFNIGSALKRTLMSDENYIKLIMCIFAQISEAENGSFRPLYIAYDGTREHMMALLYCIYYVLPYYLRKKLSVASAPSKSAANTNIIFSQFAEERHETYVNPMTGKNNILTERIVNRIKRMGFITYGAKNYKEDLIEYFRNLNDNAHKLGDLNASNEIVLKVAHQMIFEEKGDLDNHELDIRLSDALRINSTSNSILDERIAKLLGVFCERDLKLTPENEERLYNKASLTNNKLLKENTEKYRLNSFSKLDDKEAISKLKSMNNDDREKIILVLVNTDGGKDILEKYYNSLINDSKTYNDLEGVIKEINKVDGLHTKLLQNIKEKSKILYVNIIQSNDNMSSGFDKYMSLCKTIMSEHEFQSVEEDARADYVKNMKLESIDLKNRDLYRKMRIDTFTDEYLNAKILNDYLKVYDSYNKSNIEKFMNEVNIFFVTYNEELGNENKEQLYNHLMSEIDKSSGISSPDKGWIEQAYLTPNNELCNKLVNMYKYIKGKLRKKSDAVKYYKNYIEGLDEDSAKKFNEFFAKELLSYDKKNIVPLDIWLSLGMGMSLENPLFIFDEDVFNEDKPQILISGVNIVKPYVRVIEIINFIELAEKYIKKKGREKETVKSWIQYIKRKSELDNKNLNTKKNNGNKATTKEAETGEKSHVKEEKTTKKSGKKNIKQIITIVKERLLSIIKDNFIKN